MPQDPQKEIDAILSPQANNPNTPQSSDPRSFVLPNKEVHDILNAERITADVLLKQEAIATLPTPPPIPAIPTFDRSARSSIVRPLETYQTDMDMYVQDNKVSAVTVVAAEDSRRVENEKNDPHSPRSLSLQAIAVFCGILLLVGAGGALAYVYMRAQPLPKQQAAATPYIAVDTTSDVPIASDTRDALLESLQQAQSQTHLSLGLVEQLHLWLRASTTPEALSGQEFLSTIAPSIPPTLLRNAGHTYMVGVHAFATTQPFFLFSVETYEGGYAGMLDWEKTMQGDLFPFFNYTPAHTDTPTTLDTADATQVIASPFVDMVLENRDVRVLKNTSGDIILLWTFIDRTTVLVTTNKDTLHEIVSRVTKAPTFTIPTH